MEIFSCCKLNFYGLGDYEGKEFVFPLSSHVYCGRKKKKVIAWEALRVYEHPPTPKDHFLPASVPELSGLEGMRRMGWFDLFFFSPKKNPNGCSLTSIWNWGRMVFFHYFFFVHLGCRAPKKLVINPDKSVINPDKSVQKDRHPQQHGNPRGK